MPPADDDIEQQPGSSDNDGGERSEGSSSEDENNSDGSERVEKSDASGDEVAVEQAADTPAAAVPELEQTEDQDSIMRENEEDHDVAPSPKEKRKKKEKGTADSKTKQKTGVIYLSRVPPGLQPNNLRSLLTPVGPVGRIWLRVEDTSTKTNALASVNNNKDKYNHGGQNFQDGWVEFERLRDARRAVALLNGHPMHTRKKKKGKFSNDLWSMKLLRGFTWAHLDREVFGGTQRERILKVREQIETARREKNWVESRFDLSKQIRKKRDYKGKVTPGSKRFKQTQSVAGQDGDDADERKAHKAARRVDNEIESGHAKQLDPSLLQKLFRT